MKRFIHITPNSTLVGPHDPELWEVAIVMSEGCEQALTLEEKQDVAKYVRHILDKKQRSIVNITPIIPMIQSERTRK